MSQKNPQLTDSVSKNLVSLFENLEKKEKRVEIENSKRALRLVDNSDYGMNYKPTRTETKATNFNFKGYMIFPVANYSVRARIIEREITLKGWFTPIAKTLLLVGWGQIGISTKL